uniref:Uncharacterized protein n=1 Tax=Scleropages formosus TaxID=113540 RepID=A0A8C9V6G3_SCLFO
CSASAQGAVLKEVEKNPRTCRNLLNWPKSLAHVSPTREILNNNCVHGRTPIKFAKDHMNIIYILCICLVCSFFST